MNFRVLVFTHELNNYCVLAMLLGSHWRLHCVYSGRRAFTRVLQLNTKALSTVVHLLIGTLLGA